jgi:very-short-patch-repair endonuclease
MICDFYCHAAGLVIECDGAYHQEPDQASRDLLRDTLARESHLTVLRFTNEDILFRTEFVLEPILANLMKVE